MALYLGTGEKQRVVVINGYDKGFADGVKSVLNKPHLSIDSSVTGVYLPVYLPTTTIDIKRNMMVNAGRDISNKIATIQGDTTVGSILSIVSDDFDVTQCNYKWYGITIQEEQTKYAHTPNISDDGIQNGNYNNGYANTQVVAIEGAEQLTVTIKYSTESKKYDYVCVYAGNHPNYTTSDSGYLKKLGGADAEETFTVDGDSVTFAFKSDNSGVGSGYGYYAIVQGVGRIKYELSTENTYTIVGDENYIKCELTGTNDYIGTVVTNTVSVAVEEV